MMRRKRWLRLRPPSRKKKEPENVRFQQGTAESLPFPDDSFDIITCRYAAHHFSDVRKAVREVARVLKQDGRFLLVDHYAPEDPVLDEFVNHLNRLRDPSHVRERLIIRMAGDVQRQSTGLSRHPKVELADSIR